VLQQANQPKCRESALARAVPLTDGKEGVGGSRPPEGFLERPANRLKLSPWRRRGLRRRRAPGPTMTLPRTSKPFLPPTPAPPGGRRRPTVTSQDSGAAVILVGGGFGLLLCRRLRSDHEERHCPAAGERRSDQRENGRETAAIPYVVRRLCWIGWRLGLSGDWGAICLPHLHRGATWPQRCS
jgi:hypothetical protein